MTYTLVIGLVSKYAYDEVRQLVVDADQSDRIMPGIDGGEAVNMFQIALQAKPEADEEKGRVYLAIFDTLKKGAPGLSDSSRMALARTAALKVLGGWMPKEES